MKSRELERLNKEFLLPRLPGWAAKATLVFSAPIGDLLRGLSFEPSGFRRNVHRIHYFVLPLYAPAITTPRGPRSSTYAASSPQSLTLVVQLVGANCDLW